MNNIDALIVQNMPGLKRFALKLTKNNDSADDLTQTCILRAIEKRHLFEEGTNFFSWSSKMMYNLFVSDYRRKVKFESQYDSENELKKMSVGAVQENESQAKHALEAMDRIEPWQKKILMLAGEGLSYEEIAAELGMEMGTVRSRISRAREALALAMTARRRKRVKNV